MRASSVPLPHVVGGVDRMRNGDGDGDGNWEPPGSAWLERRASKALQMDLCVCMGEGWPAGRDDAARRAGRDSQTTRWVGGRVGTLVERARVHR